MYKHASRNLQRRHAVDRPLPTGGYIGEPTDDADQLPAIAALSLEQCRAERDQLRREIGIIEQEIAVAKAAGNKRERESAGQRKAALTFRLSAINKRIYERNDDSGYGALARAVREIAPDLADAIFAKAREFREAALASCDTHPKGGDALAAPFMSGAVGEAETPNDHSQSGHPHVNR